MGELKRPVNFSQKADKPFSGVARPMRVPKSLKMCLSLEIVYFLLVGVLALNEMLIRQICPNPNSLRYYTIKKSTVQLRGGGGYMTIVS